MTANVQDEFIIVSYLSNVLYSQTEESALSRIICLVILKSLFMSWIIRVKPSLLWKTAPLAR